MSSKGKVLDSLKPENFALTVNQAARKICGFDHVSMGILLDNSGSMGDLAGFNLLPLAKASVNGLLDTAGLGEAGRFHLGGARIRAPSSRPRPRAGRRWSTLCT
jgi:hypothetical protein